MKQITIIGHIGADAVTRDNNGNQFVTFDVAVNEKYKKSDNTEVESTQWFSCTTHNLKYAPHLKKGDQVMVQGNFRTTVYQDKDRNWNAGIQLHAANIQLLTPKKDEEQLQGLQLLNRLIDQSVSKHLNK